ncbi:MAG: HesA/MoeB/ThiF family protein [Deltaproteobacteria bacterium]
MPAAVESGVASPARVLVVGAGGLGCAAGWVLARSAHHLARPLWVTVVDDDVVSADNLHRQLFFDDDDVGRPKAPRFADRCVSEARARGARHTEVSALETRLVPSNARALVRGHDLVLEGADHFATKFLVADAARLEARPVVHGGVVRWAGYALASGPSSRPCYRCFFEDLPREQPDTCALSGVVGPLVALVGALQAELALGLLLGRADGGARLAHVDALRGGPVRFRRLTWRADCATCGEHPRLREIDASDYLQPSCA